jgi:hypothetical protein
MGGAPHLEGVAINWTPLRPLLSNVLLHEAMFARR